MDNIGEGVLTSNGYKMGVIALGKKHWFKPINQRYMFSFVVHEDGSVALPHVIDRGINYAKPVLDATIPDSFDEVQDCFRLAEEMLVIEKGPL